MIDVTVRAEIEEGGGERSAFTQTLSSGSGGPYAARTAEKLIANAAQKVMRKIIATKGDIRATDDGVDRAGQYYLFSTDGITVEEMVAAAGLDGGRQVAKAVDKDNPANTLSGCGDEHVLAVIDLVEGWRRAAAQAKRRQV